LFDQKRLPRLFFWNISSRCQSNFIIFFLRVQISLPNQRRGRASALYTFILENFWTKVGLKVMFGIARSCHFFNSVCVLLRDGSSKVAALSCRTGLKLPPVGPDCGPRRCSVAMLVTRCSSVCNAVTRTCASAGILTSISPIVRRLWFFT
jgi:hypothetical protein